MARAAYDDIADWYDSLSDTTDPVAVREREGLHAAMLALMGPVDGQRICDFACAAGDFTRFIAGHGGDVVGVDISEEMIRRARAREEDGGRTVSYNVVNLAEPAALAGEKFDGVVCHEGLMAVPDLAAVLATARRAVGVGGWLVFSITHPCTVHAGARWVDVDGRRGRAMVNYLSEGPWKTDAGDVEALQSRVHDYHRTISTYVNSVIAAGFAVEQMSEPPLLTGEGERPLDQIPGYLLMRCVAV